MEKTHKHTNTDGTLKLEARDSLEGCPQATIVKPTGGTVVDVENRIATGKIIDALKAIGIIL